MSPAAAIPDTLESLLIRRIDVDAWPCDVCGKAARWRIMSRWDLAEAASRAASRGYGRMGTQSLVTYLCAADGWEFVSALGDNLRAGDP